MLRPLCAPSSAIPIGWELEKPLWQALQAAEVTVHFPVESILQLKG